MYQNSIPLSLSLPPPPEGGIKAAKVSAKLVAAATRTQLDQKYRKIMQNHGYELTRMRRN
jgi:hypothetical protein